MKRELLFIEYITKRVYEMLVLREFQDSGREVDLDTYADSLYMLIEGAYGWSEFLANNRKFVIVSSIISSLAYGMFEYKTYRREILKAMNLLNRIRDEIGGDV